MIEIAETADSASRAGMDRTTQHDDEPGLANVIRMLTERPAVSAYKAGEILGWGRRQTKKAIANGSLPTIGEADERPRVASAWLLSKLRADLLKGANLLKIEA